MESQKHGTDGKRRVWRKLHLAVDTNTHEIIAAELSLSNVSDGETLPNLLKQTRRRIKEISGDGAYDTRLCYEAIRVKHAVPLIPPREGAAFWEQGHSRNLAVGCQKLYGSNKHWKKKYGYHKRSSAFQADDAGSIPAVRSSSKFKTLISQHTPDIR